MFIISEVFIRITRILIFPLLIIHSSEIMMRRKATNQTELQL